MSRSEEQAALVASDRLSDLLTGAPVIAIKFRYDLPGILTVIVEDRKAVSKLQLLVPKLVAVTSPDGADFTFDVHIVVGSPIIAQYANEREIKPPPILSPNQGGDVCQISGSSDWGTAGIYYHSAQLQATTRVGTQYTCAGNDVFLTCNHVIANFDRSNIGIPLTCGAATAVLGSFFPLGDPLLYMDFALGVNVTPESSFDGGILRGLGDTSYTFRNPADSGEPIRKSGARTGVTSGNTIGRTTIYAPGGADENHPVPDRIFKGIYETTTGFSAPGDSGSIVIGNNADVLGMIAWGDKNGEHSYFYTFGTQVALKGVVASEKKPE
jgi:hypothetical protein